MRAEAEINASSTPTPASNDTATPALPSKVPPFFTDKTKLQKHLVSHGKAWYRKNPAGFFNWIQLENFRHGTPPLSFAEVQNLAAGIKSRIDKELKVGSSVLDEPLTADDWASADFSNEDAGAIIGLDNPDDEAIVGAKTKNMVEAPEKSFKTASLMRMLIGASVGKTVYPMLPFPRSTFVYYMHGELSRREIKKRTKSAMQDLSGPFTNFHQGRKGKSHFIDADGQQVLHDLIARRVKHAPAGMARVFVPDPWQSFITGYDENSFKDMSKATDFLDSLIEEFNLTMFLPIHLGKDHSKGARGHSTIAGWRDTRFRLEPNDPDEPEYVTVTVTPRWGGRLEPFILRFNEGTMWPEAKFRPQVTSIRKYVKTNGGRVSTKALGSFLNLKEDSLRKALKRASDEGAIVVQGDEVTLPPDEEGQ
jgi:hypothetical protein